MVCMINCGATVHLQSFLELKDNLRIFIIDSHRPYHLGNVSEENTQVLILKFCIHLSHGYSGLDIR